MSLRLYNTLSRSKEEFVPLDPKNVRMYVCGPTVYDYAHIGNARPAIVFDVLFRLLRHIYGEQHVTYVRNVTDIDDKINARALEQRGDRNVPILDVVRELTEKTYGVYQKDVAALGNLPATFMPRATENIAPMIAMIERLIAAGHAYPAEGHVLFDVSSKPDYGKLSRRPLDEMIAGARVDVAPYKKSPMDFVLWKPSDANTPGWDSPWGRGRPGWHLECSAMIAATFKGGDTIDIHGGGIDLVFPHHENEIAQSEGAHHDHPLARYWMHNGFLNVEGEKMSKSLGNFVTIRQLLRGWRAQAWSGDALRLTMLRTHYRQPMDWSLQQLDETKNELTKWVAVIRKFDLQLLTPFPMAPSDELVAVLADDLNTPEMFAVLRDRYSAARRDVDKAKSLFSDLLFLGAIKQDLTAAYIQGVSSSGHVSDKELLDNFGLGMQLKVALLNNDQEFREQLEEKLAKENLCASYQGGEVTLNQLVPTAAKRDEIQELIEARLAARRAKDFKESDRIRDELLARGIVLKDNKDGTTSWEVKR